MTEDGAKTLAIDALIWVAGQSDLSSVFLGSTGMTADQLRGSAGEAETLAAMLDFLLLDDRWVLRFSEHAGVAPTDIVKARRAFPGGASFDWG